MSSASMNPVAALGPENDLDGDLLASFSRASLVVVLGVLLAWVVVKRSGDAEIAFEAELGAVEASVVRSVEAPDASTALREQAELAFVAGRIVEPRYDNALYFYEAMLEQAPDDAEALAGVDRVVRWLEGQVELALDAADFEAAQRASEQIASLRPDDSAARARVERLATVRALDSEADLARGRGDLEGAARAWQRLLAADAGNQRARSGLREVTQGLLAAGERALDVGNLTLARSQLDAARSADPAAPGVATLSSRLTALEAQRSDAARDGDRARLVAAIDDYARSGVGDPVALLEAHARAWPEDSALASLRERLGGAIAARFDAELAADRIDEAQALLELAEATSLAPGDAQAQRARLERSRHMVAFRAGRSRPRAISELTVLAQVAPEYPERALRLGDGWVELEFTVDERGLVRDPVVLDSSARAFIAPSLEAIDRWRFEGERIGGEPVPVRAVLRFAFRI